MTPGHPPFEAVRDDETEPVPDDFKRGAVFYELQTKAPAWLNVLGASVKDGRTNTANPGSKLPSCAVAIAFSVNQP
jgi:hypothetical protein